MRITATQIVKNTNLTSTQNIVRRVITVAPLGARGYGVASGGITGQVLAKKTDTNYDTEWITNTGGGGGISDAPNNANAYVRGQLSWLIGYTKTAIDNLLGNKQPLATVLTNTTASFTTADETKLSGIATGATANDTDANLKNRENHTGTQTASTISDIQTTITNNTAVLANTAKISFDSTNSTKLDKYPSTATNGKMIQGNGTNYVEVDAPSGGATTTTGVYSGVIVVTTGASVPTGATNHSFSYTEVDKLVSLRINLDYGTGGVNVTAISCELPSGFPIPSLPTGVSASGDVINYGVGTLSPSRGLSAGLGVSALRLKSTSPNVFEIIVTRSSASYRYAYYSIQYFKS